MSDLAATGCGGSCGFGFGNNSCIWIILLLFCCGGWGNGCGNGCGNDGFFGGDNGCCDIIIILLLLSCCCGGNGCGSNSGCGCSC